MNIISNITSLKKAATDEETAAASPESATCLISVPED